MTYAEQLKHPKWQRRRLEIMQRDEFRCVRCADGEKTLNVHHKLYRRGAAPWEYEDHELVTLCEDCHEAEHKGEYVKVRRIEWEAVLSSYALLRETVSDLEDALIALVKKSDAEWRQANPQEAAEFDAEKARQLRLLAERGWIETDGLTNGPHQNH